MSTVPASSVPERIADYEIVRPIGMGNHGRFYLARPPARLGIRDELVALKVFAGECSEDAYRRGTRELRAFAAVSSPYLAVVYDAVLQDSFLYAMEYFPQGSLAASATPLERRGQLRALEHAARAIHALHEAGIAHGDIKPANIMLTGTGAKVSDLGLARVFASGLALTGMAPQTSIEYVDPELLRGSEPSRSTDIWALGATVNRVLSGQGLYGEIPADQPILAIRRVQSSPPTIAATLSDTERAVVERCLADVGARYPTAQELADDLAALSGAAG